MKRTLFFLLILSSPFSFAGKPLTTKEKAYHVLNGTAHLGLCFATGFAGNVLLLDNHGDHKIENPSITKQIYLFCLNLPIYVSTVHTSSEYLANAMNSFYQAASSPTRWVSPYHGNQGDSFSFPNMAFSLAYLPLVLRKTAIITKKLKDMALSPEGIRGNKSKIAIYSTFLGSMLWSSKKLTDDFILNYRKAKAQRAKKIN